MMYMLKKVFAMLMAWISSLSYPSTPTQSTDVIEPLPQVEVETYSPPSDHFYVEGKVDVQIIEIDDPYDYNALKYAVDDLNTGAATQYYNALWIGDHSDQGFSMLPTVQIGDVAQWHGKQYVCYEIDDYGWIDENQQIRCADGSYLSDKEVIATCTCKTNSTRYIRYWKLI